MPPKTRGVKRTNNTNGPKLKKPRRLPGFDSSPEVGEEGEDSSTREDDYDCSPSEACIPGQSEQALDDEINDQEPPCLPLSCQPCPYWEREIVKFNFDGKWDPKIKEKGHTGRPDLKGNYSEEGSKNKGKSGCRDGPDGFVALGEPCNAYRCYLDPCVPPGTVYCTLKHGQMLEKSKPNCPPKFPIKPVRYEVCPPDCSGKGQQDDCRPPQPQDCQSSVEFEVHFNGQDPSSSNQTRSANQASSSRQQQDQQCLQVRNNQLGPAIDPTMNPFSQRTPPWRRIEDRLPPEWIMEMPACQNEPKIKSKSRKKR